MTYVQSAIDKFGGLKVGRNLEDVGVDGCIDGADFELGDGGSVRTRHGFTPRISGYAAAPGMFFDMRDPSNAANRIIVSSTGPTLSHVVVADTPASTGTPTTVTASPATGTVRDGFVFSTPATIKAYMLFETGQMQEFNATPKTWSRPGTSLVNAITGAITTQPTGSPSATTAGVWASQARVVYGGFTGSSQGPGGQASSPDHVWFSEPGDPLKFRTDAYEILTPGDGERITCIKGWRDYLFVFKETKFFVFINTTATSRGVAVFNYRAVDNGIGCVGARAAVAGKDGLLFVGARGLYITRGDAVVSFSDDVEGLWTDEYDTSYYTGPALHLDSGYGKGLQLVTEGDRIYMSGRNATSRYVYVYDTRRKHWLLWRPHQGRDTPNGIAMLSTAGQRILHVSTAGDYVGVTYGAASAPAISMLDPAVTNDGNFYNSPGDRGLLAMFYRTGYADIAADAVARVRQTEVWGSQVKEVALRGDYKLTDGAVGAWPTRAPGNTEMTRGYVRQAMLAQRVSVGICGPTVFDVDVGTTVSRVVLHISNRRVSSVL